MTTARRLAAIALCLALGACSATATQAGLTADPTASAPTDPASPATRTISHALGDTVVPTSPAAVVTLGGIYTANLLSLGITPAAIGDGDAFEMQSYAALLPDVDLDAIPTIGDPYEPDLEAIAAADPDLVVSDEFLEAVHDELSVIAPTVLVSYMSNGGWRERFPLIADAVGRADAAQAVDDAYQQVIDGLPEGLGDEVIAFVRADPDGAFRIDSLPSAFPGSVAEDAGIPTLQPEGVGTFEEGSGFLELSAENLDVLADADRIVLGDNSFYDPTLDDTLSILAQNPLWEGLPAVQAGKVIQIPGPVYNGGNHYAATLLLEALADLG